MASIEVISSPQDWRVNVRLEHEADEAPYVYDLVQSGWLLVERKEFLPLPLQGQFQFKPPALPQPMTIQVGRVEVSSSEVLAGHRWLSLVFSPPRGDEALLAELETALRNVPRASQEDFKTAAPEPSDESERVREMNFAQRTVYAARAGQSARAALLQHPNPLVLLYLCKNPGITLLEVIQIAKLPGVDAMVTDYIGKLLHLNPRWSTNEDLKMALILNPHTPGGAALSLLTHLSSRSLQQLTRHGELRSTLRQAAQRLLGEHHN